MTIDTIETHTKTGIPIQPLSQQDYFNKNVEFSLWIERTQKTHFSSLSSTEAREMFDKFVRRWNSARLEGMYTVQCFYLLNSASYVNL